MNAVRECSARNSCNTGNVGVFGVDVDFMRVYGGDCERFVCVCACARTRLVCDRREFRIRCPLPCSLSGCNKTPTHGRVGTIGMLAKTKQHAHTTNTTKKTHLLSLSHSLAVHPSQRMNAPSLQRRLVQVVRRLNGIPRRPSMSGVIGAHTSNHAGSISSYACSVR